MANLEKDSKKEIKQHFVKAQFSYTPVNDDELMLKVNDVLEVIEETEEGWWKGVLNGATGMFPSNFVIELDKVLDEHVLANNLSPVTNSSKLNTSAQHESLNSYVNNIGTPTKPENRMGLVPDVLDGSCASKSHAEPITSEKKGVVANKKPPDSVAPRLPPKPVREQARAVFPYKAQNEDELSLKEGDIITVISKEIEDKGWWRGELNNRVGVFPDNFVKLLKGEEQKKPERPDKPASVLSARSSLKSTGSDKCASELSPKVEKKIVKTPPVKPPPPEINKKESDRPLPPFPTKKPQPPQPIQKPSRMPVGGKLLIKSPTSEGTSLVSSNFEKTETKSVSEIIQDKEKMAKKEFAFDAIEPSGKKLVHLTANRAKAPNRRPPSCIFLKDNEKDVETSLNTDSRRLSEPLLAEIKTLLPLSESEKTNSISNAELKPKVPQTRPVFPIRTSNLNKPDSSVLRRVSSQDDDKVPEKEVKKTDTPWKLPTKDLPHSFLNSKVPSNLPSSTGDTVIDRKMALASKTHSNLTMSMATGLLNETRKLPASAMKNSADVMPDLTLTMNSGVKEESLNGSSAVMKQLSDMQEDFEQFKRKVTKDMSDLKAQLESEIKERQHLEMELQKMKAVVS